MSMYLYRLDSDYKLSIMIEGYSSLIWTERYREPSEFELKSNDVLYMFQNLPLGCLLSLQDSTIVMLVEGHSIARDENGAATITVTGRGAEVIMQHRAASYDDLSLNDSTGKQRMWTVSGLSYACAISAMQRHLVTGAYSTKDIIPNCSILNGGISFATTSSTRTVPRGTLWDAVNQFLAEDNLGIKVTRPTGVVTDLRFYVYSGTDRSASIIFYEANGDFRTYNYLASEQDLTTYVYGVGPNTISNQARVGATGFTGFDHRATLLDCPDIEDSVTTANEIAMVGARARAYLNEHGAPYIFDCEVSTSAAYTYGNNYLMGDIIRCIASWNIDLNLQVTEVIRVDDENGSVMYPTLSTF